MIQGSRTNVEILPRVMDRYDYWSKVGLGAGEFCVYSRISIHKFTVSSEGKVPCCTRTVFQEENPQAVALAPKL